MQDASVAWQLQPSAVYTCRSSCTQTCEHARGSTFAHTHTFAQSVGSHSSDLKWSRADQMAAWSNPQLHRLLTWPSCETFSVWRDFLSESDNVQMFLMSFLIGYSWEKYEYIRPVQKWAKRTNRYNCMNIYHTRIIWFTSMWDTGVVTGTN